MLTKKDFVIIARGIRELSLPDTPSLRYNIATTVAIELWGLRGVGVDTSFTLERMAQFVNDCCFDQGKQVRKVLSETSCQCLGLAHRSDCPEWVLPY